MNKKNREVRIMKNKTAKRLSEKKWQEIRVLLEAPNKNVSKIARKYKIDRASIYQYAWRRGWMKKEQKKGFFKRLRCFFR